MHKCDSSAVPNLKFVAPDLKLDADVLFISEVSHFLH